MLAVGCAFAIGSAPAWASAQVVPATPIVFTERSPESTTSEQRGGVQSVAELLKAGDRESGARHPAQALTYYERVLTQDSLHLVALWKASRELVDLGEAEKSADRSRQLYERAARYARRAVRVNERDAEAHFQLARAIGRTALSVSPKERLAYALDVRTEAERALALDPRHAGALHILGVWHAEVMRLNGVTKFLAKTFMGAKVLDSASWEEATRMLEQAVALEPQRLVHRLDLARIYRDSGRPNDARTAYKAALSASLIDANDDLYKLEAERELAACTKN